MNVIFDLGGVTLKWDPKGFLERHWSDPEDRDIANRKIFNTELWLSLDKGVIRHDDAVNHAVKVSGLPPDKVKDMFDKVHEYLEPIEDTIKVIKELKANNCRLFVLSNMPLKAADELEKKYNFWDIFDGIMFSARVKMLKPDCEIFHKILDDYSLKADETVFIDDTLNNALAAEKLGLKAIHFKSPDQCRSELVRMGCLGT